MYYFTTLLTLEAGLKAPDEDFQPLVGGRFTATSQTADVLQRKRILQKEMGNKLVLLIDQAAPRSSAERQQILDDTTSEEDRRNLLTMELPTTIDLLFGFTFHNKEVYQQINFPAYPRNKAVFQVVSGAKPLLWLTEQHLSDQNFTIGEENQRALLPQQCNFSASASSEVAFQRNLAIPTLVEPEILDDNIQYDFTRVPAGEYLFNYISDPAAETNWDISEVVVHQPDWQSTPPSIALRIRLPAGPYVPTHFRLQFAPKVVAAAP